VLGGNRLGSALHHNTFDFSTKTARKKPFCFGPQKARFDPPHSLHALFGAVFRESVNGQGTFFILYTCLYAPPILTLRCFVRGLRLYFADFKYLSQSPDTLVDALPQ
jgi:hypothetical protein